jgi:O-antigen ligase
VLVNRHNLFLVGAVILLSLGAGLFSGYFGILWITVLATVGVVILILIFRQPYLGIAFMLGSLPLQNYMILPGSLRNFTSLTSILGYAALIFLVVKNPDSLFRSRLNEKHLYIYAALLLLVIILGDITKPISTGFSYPLKYLQLLILMWLGEKLFNTVQSFEWLMKLFIIMNVFAVLIALPNYDISTSLGQIDRLAGSAGNANEFGIYLCISELMVVYFIDIVTNKGMKALLIVFACGLIIPIILSGSRGAILFLVPVIAFQLWRLFRSRSFLVVLILACAIIFLMEIPSFVPAGYIQRIINIPKDIINQSDYSFVLRNILWQYGLELWKTQPILGIGSGMFQYYSINLPILEGVSSMAHNAYITYLTENGIIGLLLFVLINIRSLVNYERTIRTQGAGFRLMAMAITWESILLYILLNNLKGNWGDDKILWLCFGFSVACRLLVSNDAIVQEQQHKEVIVNVTV